MNSELINHNRSRALAIIVLAIMAVFVVRLFWLQIIKHDDYVAMANQEQMKRLVIPAKRGLIYSMDGDTPVRMVMNETVYTVFVDPEHVSEPGKIVDVLRRVAGGNMRDNVRELIEIPDSRYQVVATKVSRKQAEMIKDEELSGVGFQEVAQRVYPEGQLASQTLGFVNSEGEGQYGVEGYLDDRLQGRDGLLESVTDISNVPLTIGDRNIDIPANDGEDIVLSIDRNVQSYTERALISGLERTGAKKGSVLVMDPQNGRVLAMANFPTYKPAEYHKVQDPADFMNPVVSVPYEAGSVIKSLTVAMGLDRGVISSSSTYNNTNSIRVDDRTITNAFKDRTGTITMQEALNYSLNTGMVTIAQRLGSNSIDRSARDIMFDYYHNKFGLGRLTGIEVAGEAEGIVISPDEVEGNAVRYSNMSFGQGMDVTMLQVGAALSSAINGGIYYKPTVLVGAMKDDSLQEEKPKPLKTGVISESASAQVQDMLETARSEFYGTQDLPGYKIGGKTGTSQTIIDGRYVDEQTIGTYLGYGGDNQARYVIMVQVSGEGMNLEGGKHAAPIFTDISNWMINYLKLQPKG